MKRSDPFHGHMGWHRQDTVILFAFTAVLAVVYLQVASFEFVSFDDGVYVSENSHIKAGLTGESLRWAFGFSDIAYWHPLTWISHMIDYRLFGDSAGGHHVMNLLFHLANTSLFFLLIRRATGQRWVAALSAGLFALHPVNVETVAWVSERKNLLSTFFFLLSFLLYINYTIRRYACRYIAFIMAFVLGLLAKPSIIILPLLMLLMDYWPLQRYPDGFSLGRFCTLVVEKVPLFLLASLSVAISIFSAHSHGIVTSSSAISPALRLSHAVVMVFSCMGKLLFPRQLAVYYPYPDHIPLWQALFCGSLLLLITLLALRLSSRRKQYILLGWGWFLTALIPVSGLVQAGLWPAMAERWLYIPSMGFAVLVAFSVHFIFERFHLRKRTGLVPVLGILMLFAFLTWRQAGVWRNSETLYRHAVSVSAQNDVMLSNLGGTLYRQGDVASATALFLDALTVAPDNIDAFGNLLTAYRENRESKAFVEQIESFFYRNIDNAAVQYTAAELYYQSDQPVRAAEHYRNALRQKPGLIAAMSRLARIYIETGQIENAIVQLESLAAVDRSHGEVSYLLARLYALKKDFQNVTRWLREAGRRGFPFEERMQSDPAFAGYREQPASGEPRGDR
jgi:tetratricopeptide (TPR) repeat protein